MTTAILEWLGGNDTGSSSKALALAAMGAMPERAEDSYPHDGADFGRCWRLLMKAPEAKAGLEKLAKDGGPYWKALVARWDEVAAAYLRDMAGDPGGESYALLRKIYEPVEKTDRRYFRLGDGASVRVKPGVCG